MQVYRIGSKAGARERKWGPFERGLFLSLVVWLLVAGIGIMHRF